MGYGPPTLSPAAPGGRELAVAESAVVQNGTAFNSEADVTGLSVTFTVGTRPVSVEVYLPYLFSVTAGLIYTVKLTDAANTTVRAVSGQFTAVTQWGFVVVRERIATPGTYTRKVRAVRAGGSGTLTIGIDATSTASIRAIET